MNDRDLADLITRSLMQTNSMDIAGIARMIREVSADAIDASRISKVLYLNPSKFSRSATLDRSSQWRLTNADPTRTRPANAPAGPQLPGLDVGRDLTDSPVTVGHPTGTPTLDSEIPNQLSTQRVVTKLDAMYAWQEEALTAWRSAGYQGVVEAVTGAGKTRVAIQAIIETLAVEDACAVVLVPTTALAAQWEKRLTSIDYCALGLPPVKVGILGGGSKATLRDHRLIISTMQSACSRLLLRQPGPSLLVGDEVHRLGAPTWAKALDPAFERRLGLTATLEREDEGVDEHIRPYFGATVFSIGLARALADDIVAPFHVIFVGVELLLAERQMYDKATETLRKAFAAIRASGVVPTDPFGSMMQALQTHAQTYGSSLAGPARAYLRAFTERKSILADAAGKSKRVGEMAEIIRASGRTIVFAETVSAAKSALVKLKKSGISVAMVNGEMEYEERCKVLADFEHRRIQVIAAPRVLDEGIDIPEADLGLIIAGSASRRQLIQRLGRVIRKKSDGRAARIYVIFVEGTREDPESSAREDTVTELQAHAKSMTVLRSRDRVG